MRRVMKMVGDINCKFVALLISCLLQGSVFPAFSFILSQTMIALVNADYDRSNLLAIMFILMAFLGFFIAFSSNYLFNFLGIVITSKVRSLSYDCVLRKDITWHDQPENSAGALSGNLASETTKIQNGVSKGAGNFLIFIASLLTGAIVAIAGSWLIGIILTFFMPLLVTGIYFRVKISQNNQKMSVDSYKETNSLISEGVTSMKTVRSFSNEKKLVKMLDDLMDAPIKKGIK